MKREQMIFFLLFIGFSVLFESCGDRKSVNNKDKEESAVSALDYESTASITQGFAKITEEHIYKCEGGRKTDVGIITSFDGKQWTVPASTNFSNQNFPAASDMYNSCNGNTYSDVQEAISKLDGSNIIEIDQDGTLFTAYFFADNYFEMYINGIPVGKDMVPFTPFNSSIVRFTVMKPYTIAMKLVDWEENLGLGSENSRGNAFHAGDGGMVAVIKDMDNNTIAITDENWKAQTFYTAPIKDLSCVTETGLIRASKNCDETDSNEGTSYFGLHWEIPNNWEKEIFDDSNWPNATTYTNNTIGVDNKKSYTNFMDIFDNPTNDAKFIWSSNVVLDNEVIVRYTVK
jgi:hypothetical protein